MYLMYHDKLNGKKQEKSRITPDIVYCIKPGQICAEGHKTTEYLNLK